MPNFYELDYILDSNLKQTLLDQVESFTFSDYTSAILGPQTTYQVLSTRAGDLTVTPEMELIREAISDLLGPPEGITLIKLFPNTNMGIHIDAASNAQRETVFASLLSPSCGANTSLRFYDKNLHLTEQYLYDNGKSILLDTNILHQPVNYEDTPRYTFEMGYSKSISDLITLYES